MKQSSFFLSFLHPVFATLAFESLLLFVWYLKHPAQLSDALIVRLVKKIRQCQTRAAKNIFQWLSQRAGRTRNTRKAADRHTLMIHF